VKTFADFNIDEPRTTSTTGNGKTHCPRCTNTRKNKRDPSLSVNVNEGVWKCHHCQWTGSLKQGEEYGSAPPKRFRKPVYEPAMGLLDAAVAMFQARGIPLSLIEQEGISCADAWMPQDEGYVPCIQFPYRKQGEVVNVKYRGLRTKSFRQEAQAEKVFYRQDSIAKDCAVITEGEFDALSCVVAGFASAVSVPDGAPSVKAKDFSSKFTYLDQEPDPFEGVEMIILAVDNDGPGLILREELARRLGRERCCTVVWPEGCKDANDVLVKHDAATLRRCLAAAAPWPVQDAVYITDLAEEIQRLAVTGLPRGLSTGWASLDAVFTIAPGQVTVITGIPSHGKSQFVDALAVNLMQLHGWRFVICSPENFPTALHGVTLMEKWADRTVRHHAPQSEAQAFAPGEMAQALAEMHEAMNFIAPTDSMTIADLLARSTTFVRRRGIQGLIIDPWNEFDHTRDRRMTEAEYINETLGAVRRWARQWSVHVFIVAHPTKMQKNDEEIYPVPTPYDINGGAAWRNKSENCLAVWRTLQPDDPLVEIHIQKVRWRNLGTMGEVVSLRFNQWTGRYDV